MKKITVYCASSNNLDVHYYEEAKRIGAHIANQGWAIIYGAGSAGLMGALADSALEHNGYVIGVIPEFMKKVEWDHKGIQEVIETEDMAERKKILVKDTDAVLTLPGGLGTFEELMEILSARRLGLFTKPVIIYNYRGYYDAMIQMLEKSIEEKFMGDEYRAAWIEIKNLEELFPAIENAGTWETFEERFSNQKSK